MLWRARSWRGRGMQHLVALCVWAELVGDQAHNECREKTEASRACRLTKSTTVCSISSVKETSRGDPNRSVMLALPEPTPQRLSARADIADGTTTSIQSAPQPVDTVLLGRPGWRDCRDFVVPAGGDAESGTTVSRKRRWIWAPR